MNAVVFTLGCKVNEVESASIMAALEGMGFTVSDKLCPADIYVLNTCAVTKEAEKKSRQLIARVKKYNDKAQIFVCGCASQKNGEQFNKEGVNFICGANKKEQILCAVAKKFDFEQKEYSGLPFPKQVKTRAFIKIEDGCNNFCSYCIIPYLRGRVQSRTIEDIICEINQTDSPEVVLTGINISAWTQGEKTLTDLLLSLANVNKRIRLGSIECRIVSPQFLSALKKLQDFAPQFHLSLQSGSTATLRAMNRKYTREEYLEKCKLIYEYFSDAAITTDIIAGFCGETDEDFNQSLSIIEEAGFARVHAFAFSPREGTAAFKLKDVDAQTKSARLHKLLDAAKTAEEKYIKGFLNKTLSVIFEESDGEYSWGYSQNYIKIYVKNSVASGDKRNIVATQLYKDGALAMLL